MALMSIRGLTEVSLFIPAFFSLVYRIQNKHIRRCSHSLMHFLINSSEASSSVVKAAGLEYNVIYL